MRVLITGGAGHIGRHTIEYLAERDYDIKAADLRPDVEIQDAEYAICDITDVQALEQEMKGCEAVLHLAAITLPWQAPADEIFRINNHGTFCVFHAAAALGIRRVVCASSINALGTRFGPIHPPVHYLPLDEGHPTYPSDAYSFSKTIVEETARYFWRRNGISSACLRMGADMRLDPMPARPEVTAQVRELMDLPGKAGKQKVREWIAEFFALKSVIPDDQPQIVETMDLTAVRMVIGLAGFWTALDVRDRAQAIDKALSADFEGSHVLFINDSHNALGIESRKLAELFYPGAEIRGKLAGTDSLISIDQARKLIGFEPQYSVSRFYS